MPQNPSHTRDAALNRMRRMNRWLVASAVVATGLLTDVAAQAFPGQTITRRAESSSRTKPTTALTTVPTHRRLAHHHATHKALTPPSQAPQTQALVQTTSTVATPAPTQPAPTQAASPPVTQAPVVSGGS
jgi:hypothetical protein